MFTTTDEYVLARLDTLEKERDERLKILGNELDQEKESNADRSVMFVVAPYKTVRYVLVGSYKFEETRRGFGDVEELKKALAMNDDDLYEWSTKERGASWYETTPIKRDEKTYDYQLLVASNNGVKRYVSDKSMPSSFDFVNETPDIDVLCSFSCDKEAKQLAIDDVRKSLKSAIANLEEDDGEE